MQTQREAELERAVLNSFVHHCTSVRCGSESENSSCESGDYLYLAGKSINEIYCLISQGTTEPIDVMDVCTVLYRLARSDTSPKLVDFGTSFFTGRPYIAIYSPYIQQQQ